MHKARQN